MSNALSITASGLYPEESCLLGYNAMYCNLQEVKRCIGRSCCLHLQGRRISNSRNQGETNDTKHLLTFNEQHDIISQKIQHFIITAVTTSVSTQTMYVSRRFC
jgi:hypothetical protein